MNPSPRDVLIECFPSIAGNMPISGGWGRSQQDACRIEIDSSLSITSGQNDSAWRTMLLFVEKSIYMELIVTQPPHNRHSGISWDLLDRKTIFENGRIYEWLAYEVSAFTNEDWGLLKAEWEGPEGICSDNFDIDEHHKRRAALRKTNIHEYWFDITRCHSTTLFGIKLPWVIASFCRGNIVNYESQSAGQGYSVAYHELLYSSHAEATVYFYTNGDADISNDCDDEKIIDAFNCAIEEVVFFNKNNLNIEYNVVQAGKFVARDGGPEFLYVEFDCVSSDEKKKSYMFFRGHSGRYLKVRISLSDDDVFKNVPFMFIQKFSDLSEL